ncbi:hypothetical protein M422DRAFT_266302 [Sphaerobolus stellatus SS14]|uniref:NADP-dependent oxidoreductase domain-containing protein n=1 Tax=Sphaerobolus stellatus (strain SS14) TaxID=990650 RepID=A0A0C9V354_SPHS4|nr:hypothetical protein M422DRAFT_266302 [Sphaerobolus stellatus SS14]
MVATRKIGDREFPAIGFGAMVISIAYGQNNLTAEERFGILDKAYEVGCTHWDTSISYGDSEDVIGKWFERTGKRSDIFLATKFGIHYQDGNITVKNEPEFIRQCIEKSLARLKTDYIDLYYVHRIQKEQPIEVTVRALADLVKEGKIKHIGLSECSSTTLRRAHAIHPIAAVQLEYSPFQLEIEDEKIGLLKTARELGIKVVAYSPLGRGLLTGRFTSVEDFDADDFRRAIPMYTQNFDKVIGIADKLKEIGQRPKHNNASSSQIALAWLLAQGDDIIPIPGTKNAKYLEENFKALEIQLSAEEVKEIRDAISAATLVLGDRYPPGFTQYSFVDTVELKE